MRVAFFSNYLSPHQIPFSDEMYKLLGEDYTFVSCEPYSIERKNMGWQQCKKKPYELRPFESEYDNEVAMDLAIHCDIMIWGSARYDFIKARIKSKKVCIRYSERLFKKGFLSTVWSLDILRQIKLNFLTYSANAFLFSSSAFAPFDFFVSLGYFRKRYKWGYYPETRKYNVDELLDKKSKNNHISILWCGRLIKLKHPEVPILVAEKLKKQGVSFQLNIIGSGELEESLREMITRKDLDNQIKMFGFMSPENVREYMESSDIYIFSSDFNEGWGAVLNESMNSGCVVYCSDEIGSSRYLIDNGVNGFLYKYDEVDVLVNQIEVIAKNPEERKRISKNAYYSIVKLWSAEIAAKRFCTWCVGHESGIIPEFEDGPMSNAKLIVPSERWWKK